MNWEYFSEMMRSGHALILMLDLKSKPVNVVGKIINYDSDSITIKIVEASDFFYPGQQCVFQSKYVISCMQGPKLFESDKERQLRWWNELLEKSSNELKDTNISESDKIYYEDKKSSAECQLRCYEKHGGFMT